MDGKDLFESMSVEGRAEMWKPFGTDLSLAAMDISRPGRIRVERPQRRLRKSDNTHTLAMAYASSSKWMG